LYIQQYLETSPNCDDHHSFTSSNPAGLLHGGDDLVQAQVEEAVPTVLHMSSVDERELLWESIDEIIMKESSYCMKGSFAKKAFYVFLVFLT
jgi:phosphoribosyl-ATP pyrophosphohydrolase